MLNLLDPQIKEVGIITDPRFSLLSEHILKVPSNFSLDMCLQKTRHIRHKNIKHKGRFPKILLDEMVRDNNFAKVTHKPEPLKKYKVRRFVIREEATAKDCISFLEKQKALLVGMQGLVLFIDIVKKQKIFSHKDKNNTNLIVSFDKENALFKWCDYGTSYRSFPYDGYPMLPFAEFVTYDNNKPAKEKSHWWISFFPIRNLKREKGEMSLGFSFLCFNKLE